MSKDSRLAYSAPDKWAKLEPVRRTREFKEVIDNLKSDDAEKRRFAGYALAHVAGKKWSAPPELQEEIDLEFKKTLPVLLRILKKDTDPIVRTSAAYALTRMGMKADSTLPALIDALDDSDARVRGAAAMAIGQYGAEGAPAIPKLMSAISTQLPYIAPQGDGIREPLTHPARIALVSIGPASIPVILKGLRSDDLFVAYNCVDVVSRSSWDTDEITELLIDLSKDRSNWKYPETERLDQKHMRQALRIRVSTALGGMARNADKVSVRLDAMLVDTPTDDYSREYIIHALNRLGRVANSKLELLRMYDDEKLNYRSRLTAGHALARQGLVQSDRIVPLVIKHFTDKSRDHYQRADEILLLEHFPDSVRQHLKLLVRSLSDTAEEPILRHNVAALLERHGGPEGIAAVKKYRKQ